MILVSWYGRANYSLLDRYLLTVNFRADGSSRFADGHRWGFFPSVAAGWRIKDEKFLKDVDAISELKLRLSWGQTGQQNTGREYYTPTYKMTVGNDRLYPIGPNNPGTLFQPLVYNNDLTWETTTTWNKISKQNILKPTSATCQTWSMSGHVRVCTSDAWVTVHCPRTASMCC